MGDLGIDSACPSYNSRYERGLAPVPVHRPGADSDWEAPRNPARRRRRERGMDDVVNRFARELADAIAAAVAENAQVEACSEKARAAGFEMKVTLEAVVGFVSRAQTAALTKVAAPARVVQPRRT